MSNPNELLAIEARKVKQAVSKALEPFAEDDPLPTILALMAGAVATAIQHGISPRELHRLWCHGLANSTEDKEPNKAAD